MDKNLPTNRDGSRHSKKVAYTPKIYLATDSNLTKRKLDSSSQIDVPKKVKANVNDSNKIKKSIFKLFGVTNSDSDLSDSPFE